MSDDCSSANDPCEVCSYCGDMGHEGDCVPLLHWNWCDTHDVHTWQVWPTCIKHRDRRDEWDALKTGTVKRESQWR